MSSNKYNKRSDVSKLLQLARKGDLFRDQHGRACGTFQHGGQSRTVLLDSNDFRTVLKASFYENHKRAVNNRDLDVAINEITARAQHAPIKETFVRVGYGDGIIVLDLARDDGQVVLIEPGLWKLSKESPVKFRRPKGMLPLPIPVEEPCNLRRELARVMRIGDPIAQVLLTSYVVGLLSPTIPLPVLEVVGPQGSAKSTRTKTLRHLIDPNSAPVRRIPSDERNLFIAASNSWLLCLDNVSRIPNWFSDAVCSIATGGGHAVRKNYEDEVEVLFNVRRPVVINSIHEVITRPDLRDRAIPILCPKIEEDERITEEMYWKEFHNVHPRLLGAILDCAATALLVRKWIKLSRFPRMADWYHWVWAATEESAMGVSAEEFQQAFKHSRELSRELAIDASPIGRALILLVEDNEGHWTGTSTELLEELTVLTRANPRRRRDWPASPEALRHELKRIEPDLQSEGLLVTHERSKSRSRERLIVLELKK